MELYVHVNVSNVKTSNYILIHYACTVIKAYTYNVKTGYMRVCVCVCVLINGRDTATHKFNNSNSVAKRRDKGIRLKWTDDRDEYTQTVRVNFVKLVHNDVSASFYLLPVTYDSQLILVAVTDSKTNIYTPRLATKIFQLAIHAEI